MMGLGKCIPGFKYSIILGYLFTKFRLVHLKFQPFLREFPDPKPPPKSWVESMKSLLSAYSKKTWANQNAIFLLASEMLANKDVKINIFHHFLLLWTEISKILLDSTLLIVGFQRS